MTEQQHTPDGLPVITEATYLSLVDIIKRDLKKDRWGREMREKILKETPTSMT